MLKREERTKRQRLEQSLKKEGITYKNRTGMDITRWVVKHHYIRNDRRPTPSSWLSCMFLIPNDPSKKLHLLENIYDKQLRDLYESESKKDFIDRSGFVKKIKSYIRFYFYGWLFRLKYRVRTGPISRQWRNLIFCKAWEDSSPPQTVDVLWFTFFWKTYRYAYRERYQYILLDHNNFITRWFATKLFNDKPPNNL